ncbi:MAG: SLC13/DASS family transporter, partial [Gammaproteobacteria bacterium]|nr:SLC13/DASS family transporter [Gammaproteobacteria bacterium]
AYVTQLFSAAEAMAPFAHPIIFLFMGGFTLAALLQEYRIDHWLASKVTFLTGNRLWPSVFLFLSITTLLSMWMSNTSATAMMLPVALGLIDNRYPRMRMLLILGTAYAANIGGLATLIGSPPNAIASAALDMDFIGWLRVGLPATVLLFPIVILVLYFVIRPELNAEINALHDEKQPMEWSPKAKGAIALFLLTVLMWVFSRPISDALGLKGMDYMVAVLVTALAPGLGLLEWKKLEHHIDWGVLILFGGGLCLGAILSQTGTSSMLAQELFSAMAESPGWLLILAAIATMVFLTEFTSNSGSAAIMVPVAMAIALEFDPSIMIPLVFGVGVAATCAFMLPVATPPNALAYGTGEVRQRVMLKAGVLLNLIAIPLLWGLVMTLS